MKHNNLFVFAMLLGCIASMWATLYAEGENEQNIVRIEVQIVDGEKTIQSPTVSTLIGQKAEIVIAEQHVIGGESEGVTIKTGTFLTIQPSLQDGIIVLAGCVTLKHLVPGSEQKEGEVLGATTESSEWVFKIKASDSKKWYLSPEVRKGYYVKVRASLMCK